MDKQTFFSSQITIPAGQIHRVVVSGNYVIILENDLATNPNIGIGGQAFYELPGGIGVPYPDGFTSVYLENPAGAAMTLFVVICEGAVRDNRLTFSSTLPVNMVLPLMVDVRDVSIVIETPMPIVALPLVPELIDNAAAVNVGGGVVGIPVTGQPFATGESVTIANTVNYNGTYLVLASSGANQVDITETFNAENFDGVDDSIVVVTARSIAANTDRKELELHNNDGAIPLYFGDANVNPENYRGIPIMAGDGEIITNQAKIYFAAPTAAGLAGVLFSYAEHIKT